MTLELLSPKQKELLCWAFRPGSREKYRAVICDGAVRSGKTICMLTAFVLWAMGNFEGASFGICGKTAGSVERNLLAPLQSLDDIGAFFAHSYTRSTGILRVWGQGRENRFYIFGGRDESSYMLIQGITLSGVLFDEVALMPRSFVEQAIARTLSVDTAKLWFNCNPESPNHWFYEEWVQKAQEKRALHLHFLMEDNPILSEKALEDAARMYSGVFYERYILGRWVAAEGLIYTMFHREFHVVAPEARPYERYVISCDYGTVNPTSAGLWGLANEKWYRLREYYFDSRREKQQRTDEEHYGALVALAGDSPVEKVIVDPAAASFMECIRRHGRFLVEPASNRVLDGIRQVAVQLRAGTLFLNNCCADSIREFGLYRWDEKSAEDRPLKTDDHAMDDIRYFVRAVFRPGMVEF